MEERMTVTEFIKRFDSGEFDNPDTYVQINAGWYDWFCKDKSLYRKTKILGNKIKQIIKADNGKKLDPNKCYVFFKNNCPLKGSLYDSFSFCDIYTNDVLYWIAPKLGYWKDRDAVVYGKETNFQTPLAKGKWKDVINFFKKG